MNNHNRGGWVMAHALCGPSAEHFVCGASPHPSMQLENMVFGRDTLALFSAVNKPLLLLPAKVFVTKSVSWDI